MLYIQKQRTPEFIKKKAAEIMKTPDNGYASISLPKDTPALRSLFDQMPKAEIRDALYREQHGLCAYCMGRINPQYDSMKIEHYRALSKNKELALDYQNYLGVCYGGEKEEKEKPRVLCCDAARKEQQLTIDPRNKRHMEAIAYKRNGEIFIREDRGLDPELAAAMQRDLDLVLALNGKKDSKGNIVSDTDSKLIAKRRGIYESTCEQFKRWDKKKCLTKEFLKEKIDYLEKQLQGKEPAEPYIGVRLYFYRRKYKKLGK